LPSRGPSFPGPYRQRLGRCPSGIQTIIQGCFINACPVRPFGDTQSLAKVLDDSVVSLVSALLATSCPPAIIFFVIAVYVTTIERHTGRSIAHVFDETQKSAQRSQT